MDQDLRSYMLRFPGSFIGFLDSVANVLTSLGDEWNAANEGAYADVFHAAGEQVLKASSSLVAISDDYIQRQTEPKQSIAEAYKAKVLKLVL